MTVSGLCSRFFKIVFILTVSRGFTELTIKLNKQYVPVRLNNRTVAYKTAYSGDIHIGYPHIQSFTVVFDTGSAHFFLPSSDCSSEPCLNHKRYNRSASASAVFINDDGSPAEGNHFERDQVSVTYGTGEVSGEFVRELVCIASPATRRPADEQMNCAEMRIIVATHLSPEPFSAFEFDGVLGLGMEALALNPEFNFFRQMTRKDKIPSIFSFWVSRSDSVQSEISFGGLNERRIAGPFAWVPVANPKLGYWQVKVHNVRVGGQLLNICAAGDCTAVLDTGTSLLGVPEDALAQLSSTLTRGVSDESGGIDCRSVPGPSLSFDVGGVTVELRAEDYSRPGAVRFGNVSAGHQVFCRASLLPISVPTLGPRVFLWGEPVLRRYYTAYDVASLKVGFAIASDGSEDEPRIVEV